MPGVKGRSGGHNAKTVKEHRLAGTFQRVRHGQIRNPEPARGIPKPPKPLDGDAKAEWGRMLIRLAESRILSPVDDAVLYQYCRLFAESEGIATAQAEVRGSIDMLEQSIGDFDGAEKLAAFQELGKMLKLESGYTSQIRQARMALRVFLTEFGLTPASRGRVKLPEKPDEKDPFSEFDEPSVQ